MSDKQEQKKYEPLSEAELAGVESVVGNPRWMVDRLTVLRLIATIRALQGEVEGLKERSSEMIDRHMSEKHRRMNYEETIRDIARMATQDINTKLGGQILRQIEVFARHALKNNNLTK